MNSTLNSGEYSIVTFCEGVFLMQIFWRCSFCLRSVGLNFKQLFFFWCRRYSHHEIFVWDLSHGWPVFLVISRNVPAYGKSLKVAQLQITWLLWRTTSWIKNLPFTEIKLSFPRRKLLNIVTIINIYIIITINIIVGIILSLDFYSKWTQVKSF